MNGNDLYDYFQSLLPDNIQFVEPYLDSSALPLGDYAQMNIMRVSNIGWSQRTTPSFDAETGMANNEWNVQRVYSVQFDFYGVSAFDNAVAYQQRLQVKLAKNEQTEVDFKFIGDVENRTALVENKKYILRYGFDIEVFAIGVYNENQPYFDNIKVRIGNRGNNF